MKEFKHVIADPMGMHARPAGMLVKAVAGYASKITITAPTGTADARRLMALMKLAAKQGMELTVTVDGADEEKAAAELQVPGCKPVIHLHIQQSPMGLCTFRQ